MASKRQMQISELIKRHFSDVLRQEGYNIYADTLVTVTQVSVSPDLSLASIYLSIFNADDKALILELINKNLWRLKQELVRRIRNKVRRIPELRIFHDETLDEMSRVDELLAKYNQGLKE